MLDITEGGIKMNNELLDKLNKLAPESEAVLDFNSVVLLWVGWWNFIKLKLIRDLTSSMGLSCQV